MKNIIEVSEGSFQAEVLNSEKPVLVDFWAPWCGPCRMIAPVIEKLAEKMDSQIKFAKLNTDENQQITMKYRIMAIPSLLVFKNGTEVERAVGVSGQDHLEKMLLKHIETK
jgi:thioredoxin 1